MDGLIGAREGEKERGWIDGLRERDRLIDRRVRGMGWDGMRWNGMEGWMEMME